MSRNESAAATASRIEVVRWLDSASINGGLWVAPDEIAPDAMTENGLTQATVGFVHDESDDVLLLVQSVGSDRVGAALAIPKRAITEREVLGDVSPTRERIAELSHAAAITSVYTTEDEDL